MSTSHIFGRLSLLVALIAGVAAVTFTPGGADARVPAGRFDSVSQGCGQIQDQYDRGVRDLEAAAKTGTQAQYDAALENLKSIIRTWNGSPCKTHFGSLMFLKVPTTGVTGVNPLGGNPTLAPVTSGGSGSPTLPLKGTKAPKAKLRSVLKSN